MGAKKNLPGSTAVNHGAVTGGPFQVGEILTSTSGGSGQIVSVDLNSPNQMSLRSVTGSFNDTDTLTGGTSGATATQSGASSTPWIGIFQGRSAGRVAYGQSIAFRNSIFWWAGGGPTNHLGQYDFATNTYAGQDALAVNNSYTSASFGIVDRELYLVTPNSPWVLRRFSGGAFPSIATFTGTTGAPTHAGSCCWADGHDLICMIPGSAGANNGDQFFRVSDLTGTPSVTNVTSLYLTAGNGGDVYAPLGASAGPDSVWDVVVDNTASPRTVHLWRDPNGSSTQTRTAWTWNYRRITTGAWTGVFQVGEMVCQAVTGAKGKITGTDGASYLDLTDVEGTFNASDLLTGLTSSATASASSLLLDQALTSDGTSISSDYAIPFVVDGGEPYSPTTPEGSPVEARIELEGLPEEGAGGTKIFFRIFGSGSTVTASFVADTGEEAPDTALTLSASSVAIEFGTPATTPANTTSEVSNLTPDGGYALYSVVVDLGAAGIAPATRATLGARLA
jgi:hypothetical protein